MTEDEFRWAEALAVQQQHGDKASVWIAKRVKSLALAGDTAGVSRFRQIAAKIDHLLAAEGRGARH